MKNELTLVPKNIKEYPTLNFTDLTGIMRQCSNYACNDVCPV